MDLELGTHNQQVAGFAPDGYGDWPVAPSSPNSIPAEPPPTPRQQPRPTQLDVGPNAAEFAEPIDEPIFAKSVAAAATYSGAAITNAIDWPPTKPNYGPPSVCRALPQRIVTRSPGTPKHFV
jgi:hypothetical protein